MISVVISTYRPQFINNIIESYSKQTLAKKELILVINSKNIDVCPIKKKLADCGIHALIHSVPAETSLGECLNQGVKRANYPVIAKFDDDDYYGKYYLEEAQHALAESDAEIVGKRSFFIYFKNMLELRLFNSNHEHTWISPGDRQNTYKPTHFFSGGTLVIKRNIAENYPFPDINRGEDGHFQRSCFLNGIRMYSTSRMNYAYLRYPNAHHHMYENQDFLLKKRSDFVVRTATINRYVDQANPEP